MGSITTRARCFPPREAASHVRQINDTNFEGNCMLKPSLLSDRKRACSEQHSGQSVALPPSKRRKDHHSSELRAKFYDNLSQIHLTQGALREFNRRNTSHTTQKQSSVTSERGRVVHLCKPDPKTLKGWKTFSRHGGPDLSDLRSFPEPVHIKNRTMSRSSTQSRQRDSAPASTRPTSNTTRTKSTGVYDRDFHQHLVDHNIYPDAYEYPDGSLPAEPSNWDELQHILTQPRPSLSPSQFSDQRFKEFKKANAHAPKEKQVSEKVIPIIEGTIQDEKCRSGGIPFNNLDPLTDGTLKPGNPDVYYGARPEQLVRQVRTEIGGKIVPSTSDHLPMVPNFFLAVKGPDGSAAVARRQACYDGALGARGMAGLRSYGQDDPAYGTAYTISTTYHDGQLQMYTSHLAQPSSPGGRPKYYMTQLNSWGMTGNADTCRQGVRAYRNARDWAKEQRDDLIRRANETVALAEAEAIASPALSFVTAGSDTEAYTTSQDSRTTLNENSNVLGIFEESDSSIETIAGVAAKHSNKRKRRSTNAGNDA